ncbi:hypothetical protein A3J56_01805 [Candidatus Giovannonibacteria bacterium RIFCSPHIGHO2_02_FULL_46_20]|uniref:Glycosyltransferase RgtA/B/C/D-like domain-containing protein n=1 Tax=Candidatus Giovannonibacteria bacterium RIFCSPHIGHO2_02_FULL_46_20 TaxID=1798338 RepID=A0A1F5WEK0_9BACT|nr:MAG: hypothetical protein A3J56_01805 [Candidatus Giovannonibacteria bacterium RIFCSPHIGHO2_02_FULL_46_20]
MVQNVFLVTLLIIFAAYGIVVFQPIEFLLEYFLLDDSFYYFKTASNIALGLGPTFDGEHFTNGYHPLWMGISVIVHYLFPEATIAPIKIMLFFSILLFLGTMLLIRTIIARFSSNVFLQGLGMLWYALNPWNISFYFSGLETPLALFFTALTLLLLIDVIRDGRAVRMLQLGITSGLLILSRLDYALFPFVILLYFVLRRRDFFWKKVLLFVVPAGLIASPWFLHNYFYFGSPIPASGLSYTLINYRLFFYKERGVFEIILWSLQALVGTIALNLTMIGIPVYFSLKNITRSALSLGSVVAIVLVPIFYWHRIRRASFAMFVRSIAISPEGIALLLFTISHMFLVVIHGAVRWSGRPWYFATFPMIVLIATSIIFSHYETERIIRRAVPALFVVGLVLFGYQATRLFPQHQNQIEMYRAALWVQNNTSPHARIASFNSGIHGYFTNRFLMNSDGLINNAAYEAMRENRLWELFKRERIDYILDYDIVLSYRYKSFFGISDPLARVQKIDLSPYIGTSGSYGGSHVNLYKIIYD